MPTSHSIQRTYLLLMLGNTLATSLIWGINTIFLLDAGLSNLEAFAANAFFTGGMVLFEVPTGIVADTIGRRTSYLLGTLTLSGVPSNRANAREFPARDNTVKSGDVLSLGVFLGPIATQPRKVPVGPGLATMYLVTGTSGMTACAAWKR